MIRRAPGLLGLVTSRMRYDKGRHLAAMLAVTVLTGSVLLFQGVATGLGDSVTELIESERPNELSYTQNALFQDTGPMAEEEVSQLRMWPGVVEVDGRRVASTGITRPNETGEIALAGVDFEREKDLVAEGTAPNPQFGRVIFFGARTAPTYNLIEGRWPTNADEAIITWDVRGPGWNVTDTVTVTTPQGQRTFTIVGVIETAHPAGYALASGLTLGHLLVSEELLVGAGYRSVRVTTEPTYAAVRSVADRMREAWPESWRENKAQVEAFEKRHYEATRAQAVLQAASQFILASGAATVFAMSLMLLNGERRSLGVLLALGLGARRASSYALLKIGLIVLVGILGGIAAGWLLVSYAPMPELGYTLVPRASADATVRAVGTSLAAAVLGGIAAVLLVMRERPAQAVHAHE